MKRRLRFTKMQGLGNDFVVLDGVREKIDLAPTQLRALADRHFGVGCDQILLVDFSTWGWILIVWGVIVFFAGLGLLSGSTWSRWFTIIVAGINIFIQLGFVGGARYPLWALTVLALNIVVFYALTVRWDEAKRGLGRV